MEEIIYLHVIGRILFINNLLLMTLKVFEKMGYISTFPTGLSCDTLCNHTIGTFIEMYPEYVTNLKQWAHSKNRWVKRASARSILLFRPVKVFFLKVF
jgi:3-methyladenine DNA glycosylase AlkD